MNDNTNHRGEPLFVNLRDDDAALVSTVVEARKKMPRFKAAFAVMRFKPATYLVKVPFVDRSDIGQPALVGTSQVVKENPKRPIAHLWLGVTSILNDLLFCFVGEAPRQLQLSRGDTFVV